jgi:hypothetical protein
VKQYGGLIPTSASHKYSTFISYLTRKQKDFAMKKKKEPSKITPLKIEEN